MAPPDSAAAAPWGLDDHVDAFEQAQLATGHADLADFLPPPEHPLYLPVLRELVRVDLEYGWKRRQPRGLDDYRQRFPCLFEDSASLRDITFEEFRLRKQAGQAPTPVEYRERYGIDPGDWPGGRREVSTPPDAVLDEAALAYREFRLWQATDPEEHAEFAAAPDDPAALLFSSLHAAQPDTADQLAQALTQLPAVGSDFLGFRLLGELGRGAFGKVYLARQGDLADRLVALKVTSDLSGEWQTLAQLQHTHIVPIYSVHRAPPLQAVCMPYLGSATLADLLGTITRQKTLPVSGQCLLTTLQECSSRIAPEQSAHLHAPADTGRPTGGMQRLNALAQLKQLSFVQTVLWLAVRLTDGLAHAHGRGILHRDLKPANILLTDDGQPMLLDFNLAANVALRANPFAACVGGTLPYMAPEHLEAFSGQERDVDARSDLYAFGIILYEMLAGQPPFPRHAELPFPEMLQRMIADRQSVPPLRLANRAVPPALEAIVRRCLEPVPAQRYRSAQELHEDLRLQLEHQPLRHAGNPSWRERLGKWARRHPRLSSSSTVGAAALLLLVLLAGMLSWNHHRQQTAERARQSLEWLQAELRTAKLLLNTQAADSEKQQAGLAACRRILERYPVADDPDWRASPLVRGLSPERQVELSADLGEVLWMLARTLATQARQVPDGAACQREALRLNRAAEACFAPGAMPAALWRQRAQLHRDLEQPAEAAHAAAQARAARPTPQDAAWQAADWLLAGRYRDALESLRQATAARPQDFWAWFLQGVCHDRLAQDAEAIAAYNASAALWPDYPWSYYNRGLARLKQQQFAEARADFDAALRLQAAEADVYLHRALAWQGLAKPAEAIADLTVALDRGASPVRVHLLRAQARAQAGDAAGAAADRERGLGATPRNEPDWLARGLAQLPADPQAALRDFGQALKLNSRSLPALQNQAHVLAQDASKVEEAIQVLTRAIEHYPDYAPARSGRGVLLARQGNREKAHQDAQIALLHDTRAPTLYQVAGIYALTSRERAEDRLEAFRLLAAALRLGYGNDLLATDRDLDPIRDTPEFRRLLNEAQVPSSTPKTP